MLIMRKSAFKLLNRKRLVTALVVMILILQVVLVPTASNSPTIKVDYGTAQELDSFFQSVNERNDEVNETVFEDLNFLFTDVVLSDSDRILAEVGGIVGVDCSWNLATSTFSKLKLMGLEPRKLPDIVPANPVNSGKIGKLTTAEAIATALMICCEEEQASKVMSIFKWGPAFLTMNSEFWR